MGIDLFRAAQRIRVPAGFLCGGLFLVFSRPRWGFVLIGFPVALAGLALRAWAAGCIEKGRELETRGPYGYTRNPLYVGSFLMGLGAFLAAANLWLILLFAALFPGIYIPVMKREEEELQMLFPDRFSRYRDSVPMFVPRLPRRVEQGAPSMEPILFPGDAAATMRFRWSRLRQNREYNAIFGFVATFGWIFFRLWLK